MALPKRRQSTRRTGKRRAVIRLKKPLLAPCPECSHSKRPHQVCPNCGEYKGKRAIKEKKKGKT